MDVQVPCPSAAVPLVSGYSFRMNGRPAGDCGGAPFFNIDGAVGQLGSLLPVDVSPLMQTLVEGGAALISEEPESELTCNVSGSRKRCFFDAGVPHPDLRKADDVQVQQKRMRRLAYVRWVEAAQQAASCVGDPSPLLLAAHDKIRMNESAMASTSGRPQGESPLSFETTPASPFVEELLSQLNQQSLEVETFIRFQNESIRSGLEEARKRHHRALVSSMEQTVLRHLREKEAELDSASRRNAELEEKVRLLAAENQVWFNVARNNETIVSSLRATLQQLLHNAAAGTAAAAGPAVLLPQSQEHEEGFGESDCVAPALPAEDAQSCCNEGATPGRTPGVKNGTATLGDNRSVMSLRGACKACTKAEASVLLLPCRHVCLCKQCDTSGIGVCPICNAPKNASLQIFMC